MPGDQWQWGREENYIASSCRRKAWEERPLAQSKNKERVHGVLTKQEGVNLFFLFVFFFFFFFSSTPAAYGGSQARG